MGWILIHIVGEGRGQEDLSINMFMIYREMDQKKKQTTKIKA